MKTHKKLLFITLLHFISIKTFAQENKIIIPNFDDKYSKYVKNLENGELDIDYTDFRNSFLESKQYNLKKSNYKDLKNQVYSEIEKKNYQGVINATKAILSIDYTSMFAHKYLQQTYKILGDAANQKKYHDIEFGLLNSIIKSGDGKSCETGWHVTQIEEEYFILSMMGAELQSQSISNGGNNICDKMEVKKDDGSLKTYYFEANKVFEKENEMLKK
ncbi:hypothetical protein GCM10023210_01100 [Chryseobacterium ginsengisoli]|uniref:DUF4919 domain-containing protein n=1 Tax=Chryseobacterium ginsengisoli TaxID=363853 RepID=A0ABP9LPU6_9FLAO